MSPFAKICGLCILFLFLTSQALSLVAQNDKADKACGRDCSKCCELAVLADDLGDEQIDCADTGVVPYGAEKVIHHLALQFYVNGDRISHTCAPSFNKLFAKYRVYRI